MRKSRAQRDISVLKQRPTRLRSVEPSISDGVGGPPAHAERSEGMAKKPAQIPTNLQPWIEARRKFHLSHAHVQMARELGMNPKKLGKLDNHDQEPWKLPLREFIGKLYFKRFGKERPDAVRSIEEMAAAKKAKKQVQESRPRRRAPDD